MRSFVKASARAFAVGALLFLAAELPVSGQPCTTEIYLYIEKSVSASTRETVREFLELLNLTTPRLPGPTVVTIYSFAGDVSGTNMVRLNVPMLPRDIPTALHELAVRSPSEATTDLVRLFEHVNATARAAAGPPGNPVRRLFFIFGDFAHAPLSEQWRHEGSPLVAQLRQVVVVNRNVSLVAIQTPPAGPVASTVHRDVTRVMGSNFLLFDDWVSSQNEVVGLLTDATTPLGVNLAINPGAENPVLQIANHTCNNLSAVTYSARGDGIAPTVLGAVGPPGLPRGVAVGPIEINLNVLRPLAVVPGGGCVNLWIEATGPVEGRPDDVRRGMAPQPIALGNCAEITEAIFDLRSKLRRSEEFVPYEHLPLPPEGNFTSGLRVRGHLDAQDATLTWRELDSRGQAGTTLARQAIDVAGFNSFRLRTDDRPTLAFDGALRHRAYPIELDKRVRRRLCLGGREDEPKRVQVTLAAADGELASAVLVRRYPGKGDLIPHNPWESGILPLLCLLVVAMFVASRLRPAHMGKLAYVLLALAAGLLVMGLATHFASTFGILVEESFAQRLEELSIAGVVLVGILYGLLIFMGFFDRRPSAWESLSEVQRRRYSSRRSGRRWATVASVVVLLVLILLITGVIWFFQRDVEECRFTYTAVQEP